MAHTYSRETVRTDSQRDWVCWALKNAQHYRACWLCYNLLRCRQCCCYNYFICNSVWSEPTLPKSPVLHSLYTIWLCHFSLLAGPRFSFHCRLSPHSKYIEIVFISEFFHFCMCCVHRFILNILRPNSILLPTLEKWSLVAVEKRETHKKKKKINGRTQSNSK